MVILHILSISTDPTSISLVCQDSLLCIHQQNFYRVYITNCYVVWEINWVNNSTPYWICVSHIYQFMKLSLLNVKCSLWWKLCYVYTILRNIYMKRQSKQMTIFFTLIKPWNRKVCETYQVKRNKNSRVIYSIIPNQNFTKLKSFHLNRLLSVTVSTQQRLFLSIVTRLLQPGLHLTHFMLLRNKVYVHVTAMWKSVLLK